MDLTDPAQRAAWQHHLAGPLRGRKVISGPLPLAAFTAWVALLHEAGAQRPMLLATQRGAGPVPGPEEAQVLRVDAGSFPTMTEELRAHDRLVRSLPAAARAEIDTYDPDREALWLVGAFVRTEPIDGRGVYGGRPAEWQALEDKLAAEELWDELGVPHAPARVVPVDGDLDAASRAVDLGHGAVWAGDARDGFHGGGEFTRWVVTAEDRAAAHAFFAPRCDRVRVMPFLEGVPCSIHGIVLPDGTAAFRPVELGIMRGPDRRFVYGGQGTTWDPPAPDREAMRALVRRTGELLRTRVGYRGAFGIDGVLTADGFLPTEVNTRFPGGLTTLTERVGPRLFSLLQLALVSGHDPGIGVDELEGWALPAMDLERVTKVVTMCPQPVVDDSVDLPVRWDGHDLVRADGVAAATIELGPSASGTYCRLRGDLLVAGDRFTPLNAALIRFLDAELGAGFGPVEVAPDVRTQETVPTARLGRAR